MTMSTRRTSPVETDRSGKTSPGVLQRMLELLEDSFPFRVNFEDLTGITKDIPDLYISPHFRVHTCDHCMLAKQDPERHQECIRNKMAANRVAINRMAPFEGFCHLGVTDLVRPLVFQEQVLGVFYYGSFVNRDTATAARARVERYCRRRNLDPKPHLATWASLPRMTPAQIRQGWRQIDLVADVAVRIVENFGLPARRYRTRSGAQYMVWQGRIPAIVSCMLRHLNQHYSESFHLAEFAAAKKCSADYLSRIFKQTVGIGASEYLHRLRIDHARRLLAMPRYSVGEIGFMVGFYDQSHFGKIFRRFVGMSPIEYRSTAVRQKPQPKTFDIEYFEYSNLRSFNPHILPDSRKVLAERQS